MSKLIISLEQLEEGAVNPGTGMHEQPIWKTTLQGGGRIYFKVLW